ncbi:hypothetical protein A9C19_00375 [Bacillus weihaiensis]|uniref:Uncharacterized protein n=1 Tax=Bacillus weihaiensis TaxID=1547283 RepID=A0A1L3MLV9_9BACI|nr:hypothetical protein A9C19_00375 [Bacillus weihaiensis]
MLREADYSIIGRLFCRVVANKWVFMSTRSRYNRSSHFYLREIFSKKVIFILIVASEKFRYCFYPEQEELFFSYLAGSFMWMIILIKFIGTSNNIEETRLNKRQYLC